MANHDDFYDHEGHTIEAYEKSHAPRLDFLVEDLKLRDIPPGTKIGDFGCGYAPIFRRLKPEQIGPADHTACYVYGYDGDHTGEARSKCVFTQCNLDLPIVWAEDGTLDVALCFETLEHLQNPYNLLLEIKRILKKDGILYLSIPHEDCTHNTIYPGLLYPVSNFEAFLRQMAFEIEDHRVHDKAFKQHVFTLRNKPWAFSQMKWHKGEDKFRNIPPHVSVNL